MPFMIACSIDQDHIGHPGTTFLKAISHFQPRQLRNADLENFPNDPSDGRRIVTIKHSLGGI